MIPLHDDNPTRIFPAVTVALIALCSLVFLWQLASPSAEVTVLRFGLIPAVLFGGASLPAELEPLPGALTLLTSLFLHGGWMHLIGNMLFLWIFGNNVEDAMGHLRFIAFYLICGVAASLSHAALIPASTTPMIGASGAIAGTLGAYLLLHPRSRVLVLVFLGIFVTTMRLPAMVVIGIWIGLQVLNAALGAGGGIAWWAHVGGFVAGMVLLPVFRQPGTALFDRGRPRRRGPWE
jgi:membrane associated rhomboid family serine protease